MKRAPWIIVCLVLVALAGCKKDPVPVVDLGLAYFPVQEGHYVDYLVDSMYVDDGFGIFFQTQYELRELVAESFVDQAGRTVQRLERFVKDSAGGWVIRDVWTQYRSNTHAERVEENFRKMRLAFKPTTDKAWDLNVFNTDTAVGSFAVVELAYDEIDVPYVVSNGTAFDSTLSVNSTYPNNVINRIAEYERFAKGVGVIEKRWMEIHSVSNGMGTFEDIGFEVTYTYMGHGQM